MNAGTIETRTSRCEVCSTPIAISVTVGDQRWDQVDWEHVNSSLTEHPARPELRACVDATCPGCKYPELGFAFGRDEFVCSRCGWTGSERPDEYVDEVDCSYCDTPIIPAVEDGDTAFECCCGNWHHYDCATLCVEYIDDLKQAAFEAQHADDRGGRF